MKKINLPRTSERIRGVTLPENGVMFVCDYDEVFKVIIDGTSEPEILDDDPYHFLASLPHSLGVYEHPPILEFNGNRISYNFSPTEDCVVVNCKIDGIETDVEFRTLSGDWFVASFSRCGKYLLLAEPYSFELYEVT